MNQIGVIGLAVMGRNIALNMADQGYQVAVYNRTSQVTAEVVREFPILKGYFDLGEFVANLAQPRLILLMVQAGAAVDAVINQLTPLLAPGDLIMDGGNSNFNDTNRRYLTLTSQKLRYLGVGISGGEEGARFGPAIMPGGDQATYQLVAPIFESIAAKVDERPCVSFIGPAGAGHYVKMVHNGIEYADMQIIAESYSLLKELGGLTNLMLAETYANWNEGELNSYLIEITARIFQEKTVDGFVVDYILDQAGQKGTGLWTVSASLEQGVDASLIAAAVYARIISSLKTERELASQQLPASTLPIKVPTNFIELVRQALYAAKIISYAQGFDLTKHASVTYQWQLDLAEIALNFRGGCIIRASFLNRIAKAYQKEADLTNLLFDSAFKESLATYLPALREIVALGVQAGLSLPAFSTALSYYDGYRTARGNANLIQAQRDLFGAHTFKRIDQAGDFHHDW